MTTYVIQRAEKYPDCTVWMDRYEHPTLEMARHDAKEFRAVFGGKYRIVKRTITDEVVK